MRLFNKILTIGGFLLCMLVATPVFAQTSLAEIKKEYVTYFFTTDKQVTVSWLPGTNATSYELKLYSVERKTETTLGTTTALTKVVKLSKSGHYILRIRSVNVTGSSIWVESIDPAYAKVDNQPKGWWFYGYVAGPGQIIIGQFNLNNKGEI